MTTFGTTGYTHHDIFLLYDRVTRSVWYPLGHGAFDAIGGPMLGKKLAILSEPPVVTLRAWLAEHPDSLVLLGDR